MLTPATVKVIQDIMRQDIGVDGDATRLSQMVWLIFLKILDDEDRALEIRKEKFVPTLPEKYQWRNWAAPLDGMTGDKLIEFVNNDLLPGLRNLSEGGNRRTDLTRMAFQDVYNFMRKGTLLKQVINKINEIDFNASKDRHAFNEIYERLLKSLQSAGNFGEMYTPRAVTQFVVEMVDPKIGESVLDPAVGTGGFLVHALEHLRKQVKSVKDEQKIQQSIYGVEKKPLPYMLLLTNMMLHGIEEPVTMRRGNTLEKPIRDYTDADKIDCVVTNPPFGGTEEPGIEANFPKEFQTRETADLFLVLILRLLKKHGRAGIVLPDGTLFGEGMKTALKKQLLEECNLYTIVRLPKSVFAPYTSIATNLLFFTKGEPTKEVWYYEHHLPEGQKAYSMTNPIKIEEFGVIKEWWNNREENDHAWKVSIDEIVKRNYNLDIKNPNAIPEAKKPAQEILNNLWSKEREQEKITGLIKEIIDSDKTKLPSELKLILSHLKDFIRVPGGLNRFEHDLFEVCFSGQLTDQKKSDGTAKELLEKISCGDENLKNRKDNPSDFLPETEIPFSLPSNWQWTRLNKIGKIVGGGTPSTANPDYFVDPQTSESIPWLTPADMRKQSDIFIYHGRQNITKEGYNKSSAKLMPKGSILFSSRAPIGYVGISANDITTNQGFKSIIPAEGIVAKYVYWFLRFRAEDINRRAPGTTFKEISGAAFSKELIALPPTNEQERIVKKIEDLMELVNRLKKLI